MKFKILSNLVNIRKKKKVTKISNANFPTSDEGRVYHLKVKRGEVANRILTVGDPDRAEALAKSFDKDTPIFRLHSHRGFLTITGKYKGVPISIVGIGMGLSMMDFFVREVRSVVDGQLAIVRFGSCGTIGKAKAKVGGMIIQSGAFAVTRNYNYFSDSEKDDQDQQLPTTNTISSEKPYNFTKIFYADSELSKEVESQLLKTFDKEEIFMGLNATCDSFYSSQGRHDDNFRDYNSDLLSTISTTYPETISLEMETFMLFHLAKSSTPLSLKEDTSNTLLSDKDNSSIKASSAGMVFADRVTNEFISPDRIQYLQKVAGKAILNSLVEIELNSVHPDNEECVWNMKG